jgi:hypothetical protein
VAAQKAYGKPTSTSEAGMTSYALAKAAQAFVKKAAASAPKKRAPRATDRPNPRVGAIRPSGGVKKATPPGQLARGVGKRAVKQAEIDEILAVKATLAKPSKRNPSPAKKEQTLRTQMAGESSTTKVTSGYRPMSNPATKNVTKRRVGTQGQAVGSVKAKANKEIKRERKARGEYLYDKPSYGRKSVNGTMPKSRVNKGQRAAGARYTAAAKKK